MAGVTAPVHASPDGAAYRGLVPPSSAYSSDVRDTLTSPGLWSRQSQLGLRSLPRAVRRDGVSSSQHAGGFTLYGGTRVAQRLGVGYAQPYSGLRYPLSADWSSTLEASFNPALPASPRGYTLLGRVDRSLPGGWGLSLGLQYNVHELNAPGTQMVAGNWLNPLSQGLRHSTSTYGKGYELRLSYRYGVRNSVGLSFGSVREFDFTRQWLGSYPAEGRQYSLTGQHWLTPDWTFSYGLVAQEQGGPRGQGLRLGLRYSF